MQEQESVAARNKAKVLAMMGRYNAHDYDGVISHLSKDAVYVAPGGSTATPEEARRVLRGLFIAFPDEAVEITNIVADETTVFLSFMDRGTHLGPLGPIAATGRPFARRAPARSR